MDKNRAINHTSTLFAFGSSFQPQFQSEESEFGVFGNPRTSGIKQTAQAENHRSRKQNRIYQHFGRLFLSGTLKNVPCSLNELLVNFREESNGIGGLLTGSNSNGWPTGPVSIC